MTSFIGFLLLGALFAVYDAIRKLNENTLIQTEEIRKMRQEVARRNE